MSTVAINPRPALRYRGCRTTLLLPSQAAAGPKPPENQLRSFFVVYNGSEVTEVEPVGSDVRVRVIEAGPADQHCPNLVVSAVERTIPHTTVQAVARAQLCSISASACR